MNKKTNEILKFISDVIIGIITFIIICPMKENKIILFCFTIIYLAIEFILHRDKVIKFYFKSGWMYLGFIWIILHIIVGFIMKIPYMHAINNIACLFAMTIYLYIYQIGNREGLKVIGIISLITIILVNINTIIQLQINPYLSRIISGANQELEQFGLGNYSYIYGLIFVVFALIGLMYSKKIKKIYKVMNIIIIILCCITIIMARFVISYAILLVGIIMILFKINNWKKMLIFISISIILFLGFSGLTSKVCESIAANTNDYIVKSRMQEISKFLKDFDLTKTEDLRLRIEAYSKSINAIKKSPIFGMFFNNNLEMETGAHSAFLDEIAELGIVFSLLFFIILYQILNKIYNSIGNKIGKNVCFVSIICLIIMGSINTIMFVPLLWMIFVINPIICQQDIEKIENTFD